MAYCVSTRRSRLTVTLLAATNLPVSTGIDTTVAQRNAHPFIRDSQPSRISSTLSNLYDDQRCLWQPADHPDGMLRTGAAHWALY
jgi:hypothetical protein